MSITFPLKNSLVAFLDIIGFSDRFSEDPDSCIELISIFSNFNGVHFDKIANNKRETRVASLAFSDNIAISIPCEINSSSDSHELFAPLFTFLHAISLFSFAALEKGFYVRGAIAYGETYQTASEIAGNPHIEAVKYEKVANYPRIILSPSALTIMEEVYQQHIYGWNPEQIRLNLGILKDPIDGTIYFDWLNFFKNNFNHDRTKQLEINNVINSAKIKLTNSCSSIDKIETLQKLNWMKNYLNTIVELESVA